DVGDVRAARIEQLAAVGALVEDRAAGEVVLTDQRRALRGVHSRTPPDVDDGRVLARRHIGDTDDGQDEDAKRSRNQGEDRAIITSVDLIIASASSPRRNLSSSTASRVMTAVRR